ncbi:MAG: KamA family radical SAM protein [Desulfurivibrionaceae bacterium]|nr:KamA family radical SAM protein [Desulfurivibrionaceae bacterium]
MSAWRKILADSITDPAELPKSLRIDPGSPTAVTSVYPMRINPYYLGLIKRPGDPIWRQAVPDPLELQDRVCFEDPLGEEELSRVPNLVHKYPDRALFLVHSSCAMYCRFCTRKRKVGTQRLRISPDTMRGAFDYLARTPAIRDVLVSGGDPLLLDDDRLEWILTELRKIPSVEIIRIGSRVPCTLPMRVTERLVKMLKKFHPLFLNTHFNHPDEITPDAAVACNRLADAGIPLGCQTVLLKGVNNDAAIIKKLMNGLLHIRVKPYYIFQGDMSRGTDHFRTPIGEGLEIMRSLVGRISGPAIPKFVVDLPGGGGKVDLSSGSPQGTAGVWTFKSYLGQICSYLDPA